jgi:hypothetical protein
MHVASNKGGRMKTVVLCGITLLAAATASAQTSAAATADQPANTVTLTGCVGGGSEAKPITLSNALIVPGSPQPGQPDETPSPVPPPVSSTGTQPASPTAPPPTTTPAPGTAAPGTMPSPVGTSGTKTPASTAVGTSGVVTGTAPAGSSGSTLTGYRLSGADMQPWIGKRVQVIGTFVPAAAPSPAPSVTGAAAAPPLLEFKVQTVAPASGPCPK